MMVYQPTQPNVLGGGCRCYAASSQGALVVDPHAVKDISSIVVARLADTQITTALLFSNFQACYHELVAFVITGPSCDGP
jgi:hypothetical protein